MKMHDKCVVIADEDPISLWHHGFYIGEVVEVVSNHVRGRRWVACVSTVRDRRAHVPIVELKPYDKREALDWRVSDA